MDRLRIAAIGDVHCTKSSAGELQPLFAEISRAADVLLICGDLTDYGLPEEAQVLARELHAALKVPALAVLGNHDHESGKPQEVRDILSASGVCMLDGESHEVGGVGFAGVKGFAGGFGDHALGMWGEEAIKRFVHEAVNEALKLEAALGRLQTAQRVVLLHYAPVQATVEGEVPVVFDAWFEHAEDGVILGVPVKLCPVEEMIWSKAYVMERERYDGADVAHLIRERGQRLDSRRLLDRFAAHWAVLLAHLVLFRFAYPADAGAVPDWVMQELLERLHAERASPLATDRVCRGTLLSRWQYRIDTEQWGYRDGRLRPDGRMTPAQVETLDSEG